MGFLFSPAYDKKVQWTFFSFPQCLCGFPLGQSFGVVFLCLKHYLIKVKTNVCNAKMNIPKDIKSLTSFHKSPSAFWTADLYFTVPSRNTDLLFTFRAFIDVILFIPRSPSSSAVPFCSQLSGQPQIGLIFCRPFCVIAGKHSEICQKQQDPG